MAGPVAKARDLFGRFETRFRLKLPPRDCSGTFKIVHLVHEVSGRVVVVNDGERRVFPDWRVSDRVYFSSDVIHCERDEPVGISGRKEIEHFFRIQNLLVR